MKTYLRLFRDAEFDKDEQGNLIVRYTSPDEATLKEWAIQNAFRKGFLWGLSIGLVIFLITVFYATR